METLIDKYILNSSKRELKDSSMKKYKSSVKKLYSFLGCNQNMNILKKILKHEEICKKMKEVEYSNSMKQSILNVIMVLLDAYNDEQVTHIRLEYMKAKDEYNNNTNGIFSKKEEKIVGDKDNILTIKKLSEATVHWEEKYKKENNEKWLFYWFLSILYTGLKHPRRNIYHTVKIIKNIKKNNGKNNYLLLGDNNMFIFNDHKHVRSYGTQQLKIDEKSVFLKVLKIYLKKEK